MKKVDFKILFSIFLLLISYNINSQTSFQKSIDNWVKHEYLKFSHIGIAVYDINKKTYLGGVNHQKSLIPASSLKIIPTLLIHEKLGSNYRYATKIAYTGSISTDGILTGNLYIIGVGDPSFGSERFRGYADKDSLIKLIVHKIAIKGIKCIDGNLYIVSSIFDINNVANTWQWNDLSNYYAAGTWGLNFNENKYSILWNTNKKIGEKVSFISSDPNIPKLKIDVEATVAAKGSGDQSYIIGANDQFHKKLIGTLPQSSKPYEIEGALPNPPMFFAKLLFDKLKSNGYNVCNVQVYGGKIPPKLIFFDSIVSPKLIDLIRETNHKSINVYCDAFTKHLSLQNNQQGNYENGIQYIDEYLVNLGFDKRGFKLYDGSGLSSRSFITPEILAKFLSHLAKRNGISRIQYILPQAGKDGSVQSLLQNSNAQNHFWLKSGSMENIQSYTGICKAKSGKWVSFSIMINNFTVTHRELKNHLEVLLANIYELN